MSTLVKIIASLILSMTLFSCQFDFIGPGEKGNGNVVSTNRSVASDFNAVEASEGLDVIINQDNTHSVSVEADENLQDLILTEVKGNTLKVHCRSAIGRATSKKVFVSMPEIKKLEGNSGADLWSMGVLKSDAIHLKTSSGADIQVEVEAQDVFLESSSGSDLEVRGKATNVSAHASSGSDINAGGLDTPMLLPKRQAGPTLR
ncbi:head GIN domain-containing protein [Robertkochia flava]|uniref:head GIN domain-containing protein n=1 Tax=Robertkochia flava TaxID=3447986 RepID=UPI001CCECD83|nr:head GIN domain-containing protein [Robertkochia marina]